MALRMDHDTVRMICLVGTEIAFKMAIVCKDCRDAVEGGNFYIRDKIISIGETCLMQDLVCCLRLSRNKVREAKHTQKRRWGGGHFNIYSLDSSIRLFYKHGAWEGIDNRFMRYNVRRKGCNVRQS